MKIALDENIPSAVVRLLSDLAKGDDSQKVQIVSARKYRPINERGDENWVRRFAKAKGRIVVSGDAKIRGNLHEQAAFFQAGMVTFFFDARWNQFPLNTKSAMLMQWWPAIVRKAHESKPGDSWEIPCVWNTGEMRFVRPPVEAIAKHNAPSKLSFRRHRNARKRAVLTEPIQHE